MEEIDKLQELRARGGCWFQCGRQQVHIGIEKDFQPARKAHPAFAVFSLEQVRRTLLAHHITLNEDDNFSGGRRFYSNDPWGNRIEFVEVQN